MFCSFLLFFFSFFFLNWAPDAFGLFLSLRLFSTRQSTHFPSPNTVTFPEVKTKPIHLALGDHIIVLYYLFVLAISHNSEKRKRAGIIGLLLFILGDPEVNCPPRPLQIGRAH